MFYLLHLFEMSPLWGVLTLAQLALTIWMVVDASRRGVDLFWYWIILVIQPLGAWAYFFVFKLHDLRGDGSWLTWLFQRRASLAELRHRADQSPTPANRLELGDRLVETGAFGEAVPHLDSVLKREPDHCRCLFLLAQAYRGQGRPAQAVPLLKRLVAAQANWGDYKAWRALIEASAESGDPAGAVAACRDLARLQPSLENKCLLADHLLESGQRIEAVMVLRDGLEEYQFATGQTRRRDGRWVSRARQLLKESETGA